MTENEVSRQEVLLEELHAKYKETNDEKLGKQIVSMEEQQTKAEMIGVEWQKVLDARELKLAELEVKKQELEVERQKIKSDYIRTGASITGTLLIGGLFALLDAKGRYVSGAVKTAIDSCKSLLFKRH